MSRRARQLSFRDQRMRTGRGGPRLGAGRKPASKNPPIHHIRRPPVPGRFPSHITLRVPRTDNALAYVLLNARKHWTQRRGAAPPLRLDEASSGRWFDGWKRQLRAPLVREPPEVAGPHTGLLTSGWRRVGRIDPAEIPER